MAKRAVALGPLAPAARKDLYVESLTLCANDTAVESSDERQSNVAALCKMQGSPTSVDLSYNTRQAVNLDSIG